MELKEIDPNEISVSDMNERVETDMGGGVDESDSLQASVDEIGVVQPPLVRERDVAESGGTVSTQYEVVVGQRRTLAAQSAKDRGKLDTIPVITVEWDDADALLHSISENIETFSEKVSKRDRAAAIARLKEMKEWSNPEIAREFGVAENTIRQWLEYTRDEWEGTSVHVQTDNDSKAGEEPFQVTSGGNKDEERSEIITNIEGEEFSPRMVKEVRSITGGGEKGEQMLRDVQEHGLNTDDIREVRKRVNELGADPDEAIEQVSESKPDRRGEIKTVTTFTGDYADAMQKAATDRATTENEIARIAITEWLESEGYL